MLLDKQMELSNAQAITASATSTNQLDLGPPGPTGNSGGEASEFGFPLIATVDTTFTAGGAATLQLVLRSSAAAGMTSPRIHNMSDPIPVASLVAGYKIPWQPALPNNVLRYIDISYVVATGPMTAGAISVRGAASRQSNA